MFEWCSMARMHVWVAEWLEWSRFRADVAGSNPSNLKVWICLLYTSGAGRSTCYLARGRVGRVLDVKDGCWGFKSARLQGCIGLVEKLSMHIQMIIRGTKYFAVRHR